MCYSGENCEETLLKQEVEVKNEVFNVPNLVKAADVIILMNVFDCSKGGRTGEGLEIFEGNDHRLALN